MRIGVIAIAVYKKERIQDVNRVISDNSSIVIGRLGLPLTNRHVNMISLVVEGDTDIIGNLAGRIGSMEGVEIKSMLMKEYFPPDLVLN